MDLHLSHSTALPIWNNKQRYSVFPASTHEPGQPQVRYCCTEGGTLLLVGFHTAPPPPC